MNIFDGFILATNVVQLSWFIIGALVPLVVVDLFRRTFNYISKLTSSYCDFTSVKSNITVIK